MTPEEKAQVKRDVEIMKQRGLMSVKEVVPEPPAKSKTVKKQKYQLTEPIAYDRLVLAYLAARWRLDDGYPDEGHLRKMVAEGKVNLAADRDFDAVQSGGMTFEWRDEAIVIFLNERLAMHYR